MASLRLDKEKGVNPRLTFCAQCGEDAEELILLGSQKHKYTCPDCNAVHFGRPDTDPSKKNLRCCQKCGFGFGSNWAKDEIEEWEKLPASQPCKKCRDIAEEVNDVVKEGGVFWRCKSCGSNGAIRAESDFAKLVREKMEILAPEPVGVEFDKEDCPVCSDNALSSDGDMVP